MPTGLWPGPQRPGSRRTGEPKGGIDALGGQEFRMAALFGDAAFVHHDETIHGGDGREAVGDGDHRLAGHEARQGLLDRRFGLGIQGRGRFVQHQDRRVLQHHAGDCDALALAAR